MLSFQEEEQKEEEKADGTGLLLDLLYNLEGILIEDDLKDFPWNPLAGGRGHIRGGLHHGFVGFMLQQVAVVGQLARVGLDVTQELGEKTDLQVIMERFERIAYPDPSL
jgi:hypothetical protein